MARKKLAAPKLLAALLFLAPCIFANEAASIASSLDDHYLAAQVLLTGIDGNQRLSPAQRALLERIPPGGIMLFRFNLNTSKDTARTFLSEASGLISGKTGIPPFVAVDHEGGLVHRFGPGVERLPSAYSFWELAQRRGQAAALAEADLLYRRSAAEIRDLGITMVLGPVAETLNEDNRLFLETRSYGPDADFTQAAASAYIRAMDAAGIASVVKHFPGNTALDPHFEISVLNADRASLNEMVRPFAGIISRLHPPAMMISHVVVPAIDPGTGTGHINASLSRPIIEGWLRAELGFDGIVIADDLLMGAVSSRDAAYGSLVVQALNAGVDMIMVWPQNISAAHTAILGALQSGHLPRARLLEAAERIIAGKLRYGIIPAPTH